MLSLNIDDLLLRRAILDWRDNHLVLINRRLLQELPKFLRRIDNEIDFLCESSKSLKDFKRQVNRNIERIYKQWFEDQIELLMSNAQTDLNSCVEYVLSFQNPISNLQSQTDFDESSDRAISTASVFAGTAAIPTVVTLSTTTVSAGGIWGLLGFTTSIISLPIAIAGGLVALGLLGFGGNKIMKQKNKAAEYYKKTLNENIKQQILDNQKNPFSLCCRLQEDIKKTAFKVLGDIER